MVCELGAARSIEVVHTRVHANLVSEA
jgi:hypothetical protein